MPFGFGLGLGLGGLLARRPAAPPPAATVLETGAWNDAGVFDDTATWKDS